MTPTIAQEQAAVRLWKIANNDSGQCRHIARFLLGLYNGQRFPFDLTRFRSVDSKIFQDCLQVLVADNQPSQEIHMLIQRLVPDEVIDFEQLADRWGIKGIED